MLTILKWILIPCAAAAAFFCAKAAFNDLKEGGQGHYVLYGKILCIFMLLAACTMAFLAGYYIGM